MLLLLVLTATPAFAHMSAGELSANCDAITAERSKAWDTDRTSRAGICAGYLNAVFDFIDSNPDIEILRDLDIADMMQCFQRYAPKHRPEPAEKAVVNALIGEGYVRRH